MNNLNVIILAGGVSSRFWPLSEKNSYPFLGKTNIQIHVERFKKVESSRVFVITNDNFNPNLSAVTRLIQKGTGMAGGIRTALKAIGHDEEVLVLNANDYYEDSLIKNFLDIRSSLHKNNQAMVVGYKTQKYFPGGYLKLKEDIVTEIVEKPGENNTPSNFVNIVFHYFPSAKKLLEAITYSKSDKDDLYEVAMTNMIKGGMIFKMLEHKGSWKSIKYPWQVLDIMDYFLKTIKGQKISKSVQIAKGSYIKGDVIIEDGVKIFEGAIINGPVYIGKHSIIANNTLVRNSIIGENCVIGFDTEVARSYLKSNVWLHKNYVGDSVIEDNVSFGSNAITANLRLDEQNINTIVGGYLVDTDRNKIGAIIGTNVRIGVGSTIMPGIKIGPKSFIGANVVLDKDVPDGKFIKTQNKLIIKDNKFDITKTSREEIKKNL